METLLLIGGVILLSGGLVMAFRSSSSGAASAYLGASALSQSGRVLIPSSTLLFWAVAVMLILVINWMRVRMLPVTGVFRNYVVGGALVGMMAGISLGNAAMTVGSVIGALLGGVAWSRTSAATTAHSGLWRPVVEVGLPAVVTMTLIGLALTGVVKPLNI